MVDALIDAYRRGAGSVLAAACDGQQGDPFLFDHRNVDALADVDCDAGAREILHGDGDGAAVKAGDPGVLSDVNRPDDRRRQI